MADQGADARSDRDLPILAGTARHPGWHLCLIPAYRILGRMGRRLGLYLPEFRDRRGARRPLRPPRRSAAGERYILRREPLIALILHSCYRLAKLGMEDWLQWAIAVVCLVVTVALQAEVVLLFIGAGIVGVLYYGSLFRRRPPAALQITAVPVLAQLAPVASGATLGKLLLFFLKAGSL